MIADKTNREVRLKIVIINCLSCRVQFYLFNVKSQLKLILTQKYFEIVLDSHISIGHNVLNERETHQTKGENKMKQSIAEQRISESLGFNVEHFASFHDGFSFTVKTELEAYKSAYKYHGPHNRLVVKEAPNVNKWLVQLFNEEVSK